MNDVTPVQIPAAVVQAPADFPTFMRNYQDMVFTTAVRLVGDDAQAEDISQEVFLKAYERFDQIGRSPSAGGWLKTVATHLSLNHLQRYRKRWTFFSELGRADDDGEDDAPAAPVDFASAEDFLGALDRAERNAWVERCLRELPEHQRVPLVMFHFNEMSYDDIAKALRVSLAKVKTDILRARAALARLLMRGDTRHESFKPSLP